MARKKEYWFQLIILLLGISEAFTTGNHSHSHTQSEDEKLRQKRQITRENYQRYLNNLDNPNYDPRAEEGWWLLYPYGKGMMDNELMGQPGRETQTNLGFDCPYFGFRFNYTFVYPMGMLSFARPPFQQPPWDFPNPLWPRFNDHSFIAPFYADASFQWVGNTKISNVYFRSVHRRRPTGDGYIPPSEPFNNNPNNQFENPFNPFQGQQNTGQYGGFGVPVNQLPNPQTPNEINPFMQPNQRNNLFFENNEMPIRQKRQMPANRNQVGMVVDEYLLNNITRDIQEGYNGAHGWRAEHAFITTWHRMAYGGAPKAVDVSQFDWVKQWQNTFQVVIASDEIRTFAIFNYARLNWTTSNEAGGLNGFGGKQAAMAGFNGGNGTGWYPLPYTGHGRIWKLGWFSNVLHPGRWIHRIDEVIIPGGCSNGSIGNIITSPPHGPMQGGVTVNFTGPCLRPNDFVKVTFENWQVDCRRLDRVKASCVMPRFHKTGLVPIRMSRDGGQSYPYYGHFYVVQSEMEVAGVNMRDDVESAVNRWHEPMATSLSMTWSPFNLTWDRSARVDINLIGYWEDADRSHMELIDTLSKGHVNDGIYQFSPRTINHNPRMPDSWRKFTFGFVQVAQTETNTQIGQITQQRHGVIWSKPTPFPWYYLPKWQMEYGQNWAMDMCVEWFEYDGRRRNFIMDLTSFQPCPCRLEQALLDLGRYMPLWECDMDGNQACPFNKGAQHCIQSVQASWTGGAQRCCYDYQGYLMFSDDWEPDGDYLRFFNPGTPARAHAFGSYPYRLPPRIPYMSHYQLDLMPYRTCCNYAKHCEFYYWRRQTNGCQGYRPSAAGMAYGVSHFVTFDGTRYTFPGKGFYVLAMSEDPEHKLMVQVRMEQPMPTMWHQNVSATVITGIVIRENNSDVVMVYARKDLRRWRYKTDVYVNNIRRFFDKPHWHYQQFNGLNIRVPQRNMNQSDIIITLKSGTGIRVQEWFGALTVTVMLPPSFNATCPSNLVGGSSTQNFNPYTGRKCYVTKGLLGTYNNERNDDLMNIDGTITPKSSGNVWSAAEYQNIYQNFGRDWKVDGTNDKIGPLLFTDQYKPINDPLAFSSQWYIPQFNIDFIPWNATLIFSMEEVKTACAGDMQCQYDYILTGRREIAQNTLKDQNAFLRSQRDGSKLLLSCGPLLKKEGVIKTPPAQNYLDGDTVTFSCKPDYFIHGDQVRTCVNGTWTPGWWAWCRDRNLEYGLKWLTGILVSLTIVFCCTCLFCCCWRRRVRLEKEGYLQGQPQGTQGYQAPPLPPKVAEPTPRLQHQASVASNGAKYGEPPPAFNGDTYVHEPRRVGLAHSDNSSSNTNNMMTTSA